MFMTNSLLGADDPPPFTVEHAQGSSTYFITCDHAGRALPRQLGSLGVGAEDLTRHIAWDIGIAGVARALADRLDAFLILQNYSRLAIDVNRPPGSSQSIVTLSERTRIPGNDGLSRADVERREREIFHPYHERIQEELDRRVAAGQSTVLLSLHSFTPSFMNRVREWHGGVLYQRDARVGHALLELLRAEEGLIIGDNQPYAVSDETDYTIVIHGERRALPHVELEIRQDLIADAEGQASWAARLARVLGSLPEQISHMRVV
jgi:predicted N-formylglutamate amidohydrolase